MKHKRLTKAKDMQWLQPKMKRFLMGCCDCGLIHFMDFRIVGTRVLKVQMRGTRAPKYTAKERKKMGIIFKTEKGTK